MINGNELDVATFNLKLQAQKGDNSHVLLGVFLRIMVKSTQFEQNWVLFYPKWYTDGGR